MERLVIEGKCFQGECIGLPGNINLLLIQGSKGMLGCGYLSLDAAEKFGHALAIVTGVSSYEDMLSAKVAKVSTAATALGITPGMTGKDALLLLN